MKYSSRIQATPTISATYFELGSTNILWGVPEPGSSTINYTLLGWAAQEDCAAYCNPIYGKESSIVVPNKLLNGVLDIILSNEKEMSAL